MGELPVVSNQIEVNDELERVEVEVRSPSLVLSVRLDEPTAKRLHALARQRGVRISDLLREAATAYAVAAQTVQSTPYEIGFARERIAIGVAAANSHVNRSGTQSQGDSPIDPRWLVATTTGVAAAG